MCPNSNHKETNANSRHLDHLSPSDPTSLKSLQENLGFATITVLGKYNGREY